MLLKKLEQNPAANNSRENTGNGVQQELPHRLTLLCGDWPTPAF